MTAAESPEGSSLVSVAVLDGPGRPVDELLHEVAREADSGTLGHSLHHTRSQLSARREKLKLEVRGSVRGRARGGARGRVRVRVRVRV